MNLIKDYIGITRASRPTGFILCYFPALFALAFASPTDTPDIWMVILFGLGAFFMRGAGCIINDILDRVYDKSVERTQNRPLVRSENPLPIYYAILFFLVHLIISLAILLQLSNLSIVIGFFTAFFVFLYPFMKRVTYWPQAFLGIVFNSGVLIAWAAVSDINLSALLLFFACFFWTLGYDTIYALQDRKDDVLIGVKSTAVIMGEQSKIFVLISYSFMVLLFVIIGFKLNYKIFYFMVLMLSYVILLWQAFTLKPDSSKNCWNRFRLNQLVGLLILLGILIDKRIYIF